MWYSTMLCWNLRLECYISSLQTVMWTLVTMTELGWRKSDDQTVTDHFTIVLTHLAQVWFVKMNHFNENRSYFYSYRKSFLFGLLKFNSPLIILFFFFFPLNSNSHPWEKKEGKKVIFSWGHICRTAVFTSL